MQNQHNLELHTEYDLEKMFSISKFLSFLYFITLICIRIQQWTNSSFETKYISVHIHVGVMKEEDIKSIWSTNRISVWWGGGSGSGKSCILNGGAHGRQEGYIFSTFFVFFFYLLTIMYFEWSMLEIPGIEITINLSYW